MCVRPAAHRHRHERRYFLIGLINLLLGLSLANTLAQMASPEDLKVLRELQAKPENRVSDRERERERERAARARATIVRRQKRRRQQQRARHASAPSNHISHSTLSHNPTGLRRLRLQAPAVGVGLVRHLCVPAVLGGAPRLGRARLVRALRHDGRVDARPAQAHAGRRQRAAQRLSRRLWRPKGGRRARQVHQRRSSGAPAFGTQPRPFRALCVARRIALCPWHAPSFIIIISPLHPLSQPPLPLPCRPTGKRSRRRPRGVTLSCRRPAASPST